MTKPTIARLQDEIELLRTEVLRVKAENLELRKERDSAGQAANAAQEASVAAIRTLKAEVARRQSRIARLEGYICRALEDDEVREIGATIERYQGPPPEIRARRRGPQAERPMRTLSDWERINLRPKEDAEVPWFDL